jgi:hypothetical protein
MNMEADKRRMKKIEEAGKKMTDIDYTGICFRCKRKLNSQKERDQDYCERCWVIYCEEYDAMYGDDGRRRYKKLRNLSLLDND